MAKIFAAFYNAVLREDPRVVPCFYESFIEGLRKHGNTVLACSYFSLPSETEPIPASLLRKIKDFNPDVIISFNNSFYDLSHEFDCPIWIYEVDSFLFYGNKEHIKKDPNRYRYIVCQSHSIQILRENLPGLDPKHIIYVPFFTEVQAEDRPFESNICFVGSKFTSGFSSPFAEFMETNPSENEKREYKKLLHYIQTNPFAPMELIIQEADIQTQKLILLLKNSAYVNKLISYLSDSFRISVLAGVADLGLSLYGTNNWASEILYTPGLSLSYNSRFIYSLSDTQALYNSNKIGININHLQATSGFSWRVCDIMASNGCLVSVDCPDFRRLFGKVKIPTFQNVYEARQVCQKLLKEENMRRDIVLSCQSIIREKYRLHHVLAVLDAHFNLDLLGKKHSSKGRSEYFSLFPHDNNKLSYKNKIRYKIWKYLNTKLRDKGII